jgi:hypothetical protein
VLKEKNMKKNLLVLVLLVTWSLLSISSLSSAAYAGADLNLPEGASSEGLIVEVTGAGDDDSGGDPGDAGDGYGIIDQGLDGNHGGCNGEDDKILDELMLILMSLIQLAL